MKKSFQKALKATIRSIKSKTKKHSIQQQLIKSTSATDWWTLHFPNISPLPTRPWPNLETLLIFQISSFLHGASGKIHVEYLLPALHSSHRRLWVYSLTPRSERNCSTCHTVPIKTFASKPKQAPAETQPSFDGDKINPLSVAVLPLPLGLLF